jgi:phage tail sheath protein FI
VAVAVPPSAIAAGIIADRERRFGVTAGPANALALQAVRLDQTVTPREHAALHPEGINVFVLDRDGVKLTAGRTLSRDRQWRQLSVRRLLLMLRRALKRQMDWAVFEPNGPALRRDLQRILSTYLRRLYVAGAFRGDTEAEAFFVRCDDTLNPQARIDAGQLVVEIGVAPAEPLEFILLRIVRRADGDIAVES